MNEFTPVIREVMPKHLRDMVDLHMEVLDDEFITCLGKAFMRLYYRAFAESPHAVALVALDQVTGRVLGGLLGTLEPAAHYRLFTRRFGVRFLILLLVHSVRHPSIGGMLICTRLNRYVVGVLRQFAVRHRRNSTLLRAETSDSVSERKPRVADITHVFVHPGARSRRIGSLLVKSYEEIAERHGVDQVDLVTLPAERGGAGQFYERLGWSVAEVRMSRSGEEFVLYTKVLDGQNRGKL